MKKPRTPSAPLVTVRSPKRAGILRKVARVGATVVATRVAAATGKAGILGLVAGMGAKRVIMRFPAGALFVTGAYMAGKLYEAKREADRKRATKLLPDLSVEPTPAEPIPIDKARKAREG